MKALMLPGLFALSLMAQPVRIHVSGRLVDEGLLPLAGGKVTLSAASLSATSDQNGYFLIDAWVTAAITGQHSLKAGFPKIEGSNLCFYVPDRAVKTDISIFTISGRNKLAVVNEPAHEGNNVIDLSRHFRALADNTYLLNVVVGNEKSVHKIVSTHGKISCRRNAVSASGTKEMALSKASGTAVDTLFIHCNKRVDRKLGIDTLVKNTGDITVYRPNVLLIILDDLNDWVGYLNGNPQTKTPNMDKLARSGMAFTNAYCAGPYCNPSRCALISGIPPHRSGIYNNTFTDVLGVNSLRYMLPKAVIMPQHFSKNGYFSASGGKVLHYITDSASWDETLPAANILGAYLGSPNYTSPAVHPANVPYESWMYSAFDFCAFNMTDQAFKSDYTAAQWVWKKLSENRPKPFFLAYGIYRPHLPLFVPKKYFDMHPLDSIRVGPGYLENDTSDIPEVAKARYCREGYQEHLQKYGLWRPMIQAYLAGISYGDAMAGLVIDSLDRTRFKDNTAVVLLGDNGWHLGEKNFWQKPSPWRMASHVPLIIRVPQGFPGLPAGVKPGSKCIQPVNLVDLYKTLTALCAIPDRDSIYGHNLVPLLAKPDTAWNYPAVLTYLTSPGNYDVSLVDWRYIHYANGSEELYDIKNDPYEWDNLAAKTSSLSKLTEMREHAKRLVLE